MMTTPMLFDDVTAMIAAANEPDVWLIQDLIEEGDQVVLAGAPKAGKTLMASQIALAVASGGNFLSWRAHTPRKVLYVNLELRPKRFGRRLTSQVGGIHELSNYRNLLAISHLRTLNILNKKEQEMFTEFIKEQNIGLVIWDVLARMHNVDENDNGAMRSVMHAIRMASGDRAHIVLHHLRKPPSGAEDINIGALGMRGASSIHGEADLIMTLHARSGQGARYSLRFSARNIEAPEEIFLNRAPSLCFFETSAQDTNQLMQVILSAFQHTQTCLAQELLEHVMNANNVKERRAQQLIQDAGKRGWIARQQRVDTRYEYMLLVDQNIHSIPA
jgi:hypothetical protein